MHANGDRRMVRGVASAGVLCVVLVGGGCAGPKTQPDTSANRGGAEQVAGALLMVVTDAAGNERGRWTEADVLPAEAFPWSVGGPGVLVVLAPESAARLLAATADAGTTELYASTSWRGAPIGSHARIMDPMSERFVFATTPDLRGAGESIQGEILASLPR